MMQKSVPDAGEGTDEERRYQGGDEEIEALEKIGEIGGAPAHFLDGIDVGIRRSTRPE